MTSSGKYVVYLHDYYKHLISIHNMNTVEKLVASQLLEVEAVKLRPNEPFTWASGWKSPIYCDNRRILSYPEIRENVCRWMADIIQKRSPEFEVIAGVATGIAAIFWAASFTTVAATRAIPSGVASMVPCPHAQRHGSQNVIWR